MLSGDLENFPVYDVLQFVSFTKANGIVLFKLFGETTRIAVIGGEFASFGAVRETSAEVAKEALLADLGQVVRSDGGTFEVVEEDSQETPHHCFGVGEVVPSLRAAAESALRNRLDEVQTGTFAMSWLKGRSVTLSVELWNELAHMVGSFSLADLEPFMESSAAKETLINLLNRNLISQVDPRDPRDSSGEAPASSPTVATSTWQATPAEAVTPVDAFFTPETSDDIKANHGQKETPDEAETESIIYVPEDAELDDPEVLAEDAEGNYQELLVDDEPESIDYLTPSPATESDVSEVSGGFTFRDSVTEARRPTHDLPSMGRGTVGGLAAVVNRRSTDVENAEETAEHLTEINSRFRPADDVLAVATPASTVGAPTLRRVIEALKRW